MSNTINEKWNTVCQRVTSYEDVDSSQFNAFMERVQCQVLGNGFLAITADNQWLKSWIESHFLNDIKNALKDIYGEDFNVVIEVDTTGGTQQQVNQPQPQIVQPQVQTPQPTQPSQAQPSQPAVQQPQHQEPMQQQSPAVDARLEPANTNNAEARREHENAPEATKNPSGALSTLTFQNFVIGESNRMAYSMAVQVAEAPGRRTLNPLFIYGKSGLGKTHLMRAIQNYINETQPHLITVYADTEELVSGYTDAAAMSEVDKYSYNNFKLQYERADVLLIDDIQYLQGKPGTLDIIFQMFNKLINQGKQIVLSADRAPKNIDIEERYTSRFIQGGTIDIQPPEVETKLAIVKSYINEYKMTERNLSFDIPEEIQMYIAESSGSNIRELKGAVTMLVYHMNFSNNDGQMNIKDVKALLENHFSKGMSRNLTIDDIQKEVEEYYKIKHADLVGSSRSREVVFPRQVAMYLCRQLLDKPFTEIGTAFKKDHTTVMHSVSKVEGQLLSNRNVQEEIESLRKRINNL